MVTKALSVLCALAVNAAHGASIAAAVSTDKSFVARAHAVMAVAMSRAYKAHVIGWAGSNVAGSTAPARHAFALAFIAHTMA